MGTGLCRDEYALSRDQMQEHLLRGAVRHPTRLGPALPSLLFRRAADSASDIIRAVPPSGVLTPTPTGNHSPTLRNHECQCANGVTLAKTNLMGLV